MSSEHTIAIVGGGAVGTALFGLLVDRLASEPWARGKVRIALFEKSSRIGPGLAFGKDDGPLLLNTTAQSMSLVPGPRAEFFEWLAESGRAPREEGDHFCARQTFGDFVEHAFTRAMDKARRAGIAVSTFHDEVTTLTARATSGHRVIPRTHAPLDADTVVLALGNLPCTRFRALEGPRFFPSPYPSDALRARIPPTARVAVLGTGLSAIDAAIALFAGGHEAPVTLASRGGMLPSVRGPIHDCPLTFVTHAAVALATDRGRRPLRWPTILRWLELELEQHGVSIEWQREFPAWTDPIEHLGGQIAAAEATSRVWQSVGEALNPMIEVLWHHLSDDDRRLFLDRFVSRFMSHWVPIPLVTARRLFSLVSSGKVKVARGLKDVTPARDAHVVGLGEHSAPFDFVVDATGAPRHLREADSPLLESLLRAGTIAPHPHGGVRVDFESLRIIGADGRLAGGLYAIGNLTSGTHFFTSTLHHNVEKANRIAARIVSDLQRRIEKDPHVDTAVHSA